MDFACFFSCQRNFTSGLFPGMIANHVLQSCNHVIVMQSKVDVNQINRDFKCSPDHNV